MNHLAVVGAGAWGTALALHAAERGDAVHLWAFPEAQAALMREQRENPLLPGFALPDSIQIYSELEPVVRKAAAVVLALPSHALRETLERARPFLANDVAVISATKGIEEDTQFLMDEVILDVLGPASRGRIAVLSGPSFAKEVAARMPTNLVLAAYQRELAENLQQRFSSDRFRIYSSSDLKGVQVGGALKNVIAIAAGASDGLGFGHNTRAALITRGLAEMARLAEAKGGNLLTMSGLAGLGDLVLTCTGELSRNRTVGFELGRGRRLPEVLSGLGHVAEGVTTARSAYALAQKHGVDLPICEQVFHVLYSGKSPAAAVTDLLNRPLKRES